MKKLGFANICISVSSLAISILLLVLWCCNVGGFSVVNLDSFVGVIVALLAIIVTIAVGWQIYNSIELKNKIEELNKLKEHLHDQENKIEQLRLASIHALGLIWGDDCLKTGNFSSAFHYYMNALDSAMSLSRPVNTEKILICMENAVASMVNEEAIPSKRYNKILEFDKSIKNSNNYNFIINRYEIIFNDFISKIKVDE